MTAALIPLPVVMPMGVAALLLALGHRLPRRTSDAVSIAVAAACVALDIVLAMQARDGPLVYWFGGWTPRDGLAIGVSFQVDQAGAGVAALIGVLFAATFVFAWGFLEEAETIFHVLMLVFLAAMDGFCLTHDLFNLFVWFEVMSVAAFALTAAKLEAPALVGALNFTVTNTLGSFVMLAGIGLLYAYAGQLDFATLGQAVARAGADPVVPAAFCLIAGALLIKAAIVPFHFWLSDAHSVAPSPVSVIFSGAMVALGLFGIARLAWSVFAPSPEIGHAVRVLLLWLGAASAVLGGMLCLAQRHVKRILAFSTIAHTGIVLIGLSLLSRHGLAGMLLYLAGHGLVKGALFMLAGILLATQGSVDEIGLRGKGRAIWPAGPAMALGAVLLGGAPFGLMDAGASAIDTAASEAGQGWVAGAIILGSGLTGAAVLRACGRIFLGWGRIEGEEERAPTDEEREAANRPLWLMLAPTALLLILALVSGAATETQADDMAVRFIRASAAGIPGLDMTTALAPPPGMAHGSVPWLSMGLMLLVAGYDLGRRFVWKRLDRVINGATGPVLAVLDQAHSGRIGDYAAWIVVGLALMTGALAVF